MKTFLRCLTLIAALCVGWATNAQTLGDYTFSTGVDASKWITLTTNNDLLAGVTYADSRASSVQNIGFIFPYASHYYTQFTVNADGNLRLGSTVTGNSNYTVPFNSTNANNNNPKINFFGCDGYYHDSIHYVYAENTVNANNDSVLVVEYCLGTYNSTTQTKKYKWQVHLYQNGNIEVVYSSVAPAQAPNVANQKGLCVDATDGWVIASDNTATHFTAGSTTTWALGTWPAPNTYYTFTRPAVSCQTPYDLTLNSVAPTTATLTIVPYGNETAWVGTINPGIMGYSEITLNNPVVNLMMLTPNTDYTVTARALCNVGDTSDAVQLSFHTPCGTPATIPYTINFDNETTSTTSNTGVMPNCWFRGAKDADMTAAQLPQIYYGSSYAHSGSYSMMLYYSGYTIMPMFQAPVDSLMMKFWLRQTSANYQLVVGVMTNPYDASTFVPVDTINNSTTTYEYVEVFFNNYTGSGQYIAFHNVNTGNYAYSSNYIDDLEVLMAPSCIHPLDVVVSNITSNSADISWIGNAPSYTVAYGPDTNNMTTVTANTNFVTLVDLNPITNYVVRVKSVCSATDESEYTPIPVSFRTLCDLLPVPYVMNFDDLTTSTTSNTGVFPDCWTLGAEDVTMTSAQRPQVYYGSSNAHSGNYSMRLYYLGYTALPLFENPVNSLRMRFWLKQGSTSYKLVVGVMSDPSDATTFVPIDTINNSGTTYEYREVMFDNYTGSGEYIAFHNITTSTASYSTNYIDDFEVSLIPTCLEPENVTVSNITTTTADVSWTGTAASYIVAYGSDTNNMTTITVNTTSATLTGLTASSYYVLRVKAICSATDESAYTNLTSFTTMCEAMALPYSINFDSLTTSTTAATGVMPSCWTIGAADVTMTDAQKPQVYYGTTNAYSGSYSLRLYYRGYLAMPMFSTPINRLALSFWLKQSSANYRLVVGVMSDPMDASTFEPVDTINNSTTTYEYVNVMFDNYTGNGQYIAFHNITTNTYNYSYNYIDDLEVNILPPPPTPVCVAMTWTTGDSTGNGYYTPLNNYYNYTLTETILTAEEIGGPMRIDTISYHYMYTTPMASKTDVTIWLQPTTKSAFSSNSDIDMLDSTVAVQVFSGAMNFSQGWNDIVLPIPYVFDGTTNLMVIVDDNSGDYDGSSYKFSTANCSGYKTIAWYSDGQNPDPVTGNNSLNESAYSGSKSYYQYRVRMALKGCDLTTCHRPNDLVASNVTHNSATLNWSDNNDGATYTIVNMADTSIISSGVNAGSVLINNLTPETAYLFGIYANCSSDDSSSIATVAFTTPASCVVPTNFASSNVTTTGATLTWTDNSNSNATYTIYNMSDSSVVATGITGTTYTVGSLTANTSYTFGLVANCSADDFSSFVTLVVNTPCEALALPYTEDFDNLSSNLPDCWMKVGSGTVARYSSTTYAHSGNYSLKFNGSTSNLVVLPPVDTAINVLEMTMWTRPESFTNTSCGTFSVGYVTNVSDASSFVAVETFTYSDFSAVELRTVNFGSAPANGRLALRHNANSTAWYWFVDDINVHIAPNCAAITNLTAEATSNSVSLSWTDLNNTGATYTIYNMSDTSVMASGISTTSHTLTGLTAQTIYTFGVMANCSSDDVSDLTSITINTQCDPLSLPFTEDFSNSSTTRICWNLDYPSANNAITYVTVNDNDMLRFSSYSSASEYNQYAYSPVFSPIPGAEMMHLRIRYATYGSSDQLWFGYRTADTNGYVWTDDYYTTTGSSDMQYYEVDIPGNTVQIGIHYYGNYAYYAWIDSVEVTEYVSPVPECVATTWTTGDSTGNGYYTPVNNYYNYTLSETIIEAEEIGGPMRIDTISYHYMHTSPMTSKTNVTIWLQPTTKSAFSSTSDIDLLDTTVAVQIFNDSMNFSQGWNDIALPEPYFFDGTTNLMVIVDDNSGAYNSSSHKFSTANCSGYKTITWYSDSQNPDPVNGNNSLTESAFSGSKTYYQYRVLMALKGCDMISCHKPTITSVTYDNESATIYFGSSDGGSYIATLTDGTTTSTVTTIDPVATFNNLMSNTTYTFSVRSICGNGDTSMAAVEVFRTACNATEALPYAEDFSGHSNLATYPYYGPSVTPYCWDYYSNGTNTVETSTTSAYYGGVAQYTSTSSYGCIEANNPYLYMPIQLTGANVTSSTYLNYEIQRGSVKYAVLPAFAQALNGLQISFDYKMSSAYSATAAAATLELGYVTGDTSTFQSMQSYQAVTSLQHVVDLNLATLAASAPAGARLAFKFSGVHNGTGTSSYSNVSVGIDNILVEILPTCSRVTNLAVSNVGINSVTLTWTDNLNTGATYTVYDMADNSVVATGVTTTTYMVTGLTANTQYSFGVMVNCSATDNSSMATVSTRTSCDAYPLPFTEDFSANLSSDPCWRGATGTTAEEVFAGAALSLTTPNWTYASSVRDGIAAGHYYKNVYSTSIKSWMITPAIDLSNVTTAQLSFDVALTDYNNAALPDENGDTNTSQAFMVIISPDGGNTWSAANATVWQNVGGDYTYASLADTVYQNKVINLDQYVGDTIKIAFYAQSLWSGGDNDLHIDNISVTGESLVLPSYHINIATADSTMGTTIPAPGSYDYYSGDTVNILAVANPGYQFVNWTASAIGISDTTSTNPISTVVSSNFVGLNISLTANFEPVGTGCANTCQISIYGEDSYGDGWNGGYIAVTQNDSVIGTFSVNEVSETGHMTVCSDAPVMFSWSSGSYDDEVSFTILDGGGSIVYSCTDGSSLPDSMFFTLNSACPACLGIQDLAVSALTSNSVTLTWTSANTSATYTVYDMTDTTVIASGLTTPTYTITGLTAETNYRYGVAANCSATESSAISVIDVYTGYCTPNPTSVDGSGIASVSFGGMTNTTHPSSAEYADYSSMSGNVPAGTTATVDITYATGYSYGTIIWVDWNSNLVFDGNEVVYVGMSTNANPTTLTATFSIPATQALGSYRMRILGADSYFDEYVSSIAAAANANPCASYTWGVAEDYTLNVTSMPNCLPITGLTATPTYNSVTLTWTDTNNTGATYTVYDMSDTSVVASGITATTYTATGLNSNSDYAFGVASNCSATESSYITNVNFHTEMAPIMCGTDLASIYSNADSATGTTSYMPGYSFYNYSYTEVIVPASRLTGLGEIKGMAFEVANYNASAGQKFNNCEIYLMHTNATSLSDGFIQDTNNFQLVYTGDLNYESAGWRNVTFDTSFMYNGLSNVLVAVRRNHGSYTSGSSFASYTADSSLARYVYRDASAYPIGEITGGTATTNVPVYRLIGCESTLPAPVTINIATANATMGTTVPAPGTYIYNVGDSVSAAAVANPGYHFTYWVLSFGILTDTIPFISYSDVIPALVSGFTLNLTAHFAPNQYTLTASPNSPMMGTVTGSGTYNHGSTATITAMPNSNTHFVQWNDGDTHATRTVVVTSDTTFTATFAYNPITVTLVNANPTMGTTNPVPGTYTFNLGDTIGALATANTGYHFVNWILAMGLATDTITDNPIGEVIPNLPMFAGMNFTVTANFAPDQYTLTVVSNDTTMGTTTGSGTYNYGSTATITATPATHYHFVQWNDGDTHATRSVVVTGNATYTATFAPNQYTLTVVANDNTLGSVTGSGTYTYLSTVTITATPAEHCIFVQWNDGDTNATRSVVVTGDATYTATFQALPQYELTLSADPENGGSVTGAGFYYEGENVTITATPNEGYHFLGWAVDSVAVYPFEYVIISHEATYTFAMFGYNVHYIAMFEEDVVPATVTVNVNNPDWGYVLINGMQVNTFTSVVGDEVVLEAVAADGYHFDHWTGVPYENDTVPGATCRFTLTEDVDITCFFAQNTGIDNVAEDNTIIYTENSRIVVRGAEQQTIRVFDVVGRLVAQRDNANIEETIQMPATGVYLVKIGDRPARRVVVRK